MTEIKLPDRMGIWADGGDIVWLPRRDHPTRWLARKFGMDEMDCNFLDVRVLARWMRYEQRPGYGSFEEDWWVQCDKTDEGAFPVWRLET